MDDRSNSGLSAIMGSLDNCALYSSARFACAWLIVCPFVAVLCVLRCSVEQAGGDSLAALPVRSVEYPPGFSGKSRRGSVSAESDRPAAGSSHFVKRVIPKHPEAMD